MKDSKVWLVTGVAGFIGPNLLAASATHPEARYKVYNVVVRDRATLNGLFTEIRARLLPRFPHLADVQPTYRGSRPGDVRHSLADISKPKHLLVFRPRISCLRGLAKRCSGTSLIPKFLKNCPKNT